MKRVHYSLLFLILVLLFLGSCHNKLTKPFDDEKYWNHYTDVITYYNFISNATVLSNRLYCVTDGGYLIFNSLRQGPEMVVLNGNAGYHYKPMISSGRLAVFFNNHFDAIAISDLSGLHDDTPVIKPNKFGEQFEGYYFWPGTKHKEFATMNTRGDRFMALISEASFAGTSMHGRKLYAVFADLGIYQSPNNPNIQRWGVVNTKVIQIPVEYADGLKSVIDIIYYKDKLYLSFIQYTDPLRMNITEISENGDVRRLNNPERGSAIMDFFEYQGYLYAHLGERQVMYTTDGEHWEYWMDWIGNPDGIFEIEDYLFVSYLDKIYVWDDSIDRVSLYQFPTSNIKGRTISSILKFNDDLVITTSSGIFYQSFSKVMNDKKLINTLIK